MGRATKGPLHVGAKVAESFGPRLRPESSRSVEAGPYASDLSESRRTDVHDKCLTRELGRLW